MTLTPLREPITLSLVQANMSSNRRVNSVIVCLLLAVASALFAYAARHDQCWVGWRATALETWREVGYWNLHGHPAVNPGGIRVGEKPDSYVAYRAFSLVPVYWLYLLTSDFNTSLTAVYLLLTLVLGVTIWWFLGRSPWALLVTSAFCLSPGYVRQTATEWEPLPVATLIGTLVVMALVRYITAPSQSRARGLVVLALVVVYSQIEWATCFALGIGWAACGVLLWPTKRRQFMLFTVIVLCLVTTSALALMWQKSGGGAGALETLSTYTIGARGYDRRPMSWPLALKRLGTVFAIGLLPLWIVFLATAWPSLRRAPRRTLIACLPLCAAGLEVLILRNYLAHHQWGPLPVIALGILLSLYLLRRAAVPSVTPSDAAPTAPLWSAHAIQLFVIGATLYCLVVLSIFRANDAEVQSLARLVTTNTPRHALIVVGTDLGRVMDAVDMEKLLDRRCVAMGAPLPPNGGDLSGAGTYLINSVPLPGLGPLVAQSTATKGVVVTKLLGWYRTKISRKNFRLQEVETFYLYRLESH